MLDFIRVVLLGYCSCPPRPRPRPPPPPPPSPPLPPPPLSPRSCLHQLPSQLPPCQLFAKLFANFSAQCAPLDLNLGPNQLSVHRWTSTWDLPSSVCTAGPQPASSVCTAGPQRPDRMPEDMPENIAEDMPGRMPEDMPDRMPEDMLDKMPEDMSDRMPEDLPVTKRINGDNSK